MATEIVVRTHGAAKASPEVIGAALSVFHDVERACTRFDPASPLMHANARPDRWNRVPRLCFDAIAEAQRAYRRTGGVFDPRVIEDLVRLGYDRTLPFGHAEVTAPEAASHRTARGPWRPRFRRSTCSVHLGGTPVDLGGIGKGLAIRWASRAISSNVRDHLIDAGGDCFCIGSAPEGGPWRVGIEDPAGGEGPVAVLGLSDRACATSSIRLRRWTAGAREVHHLIDPVDGLPGGRGLLSVTVTGADPAWCEVWSKSLFLHGRDRIGACARRNALAACWIDEAGVMCATPAIEREMLWRRS